MPTKKLLIIAAVAVMLVGAASAYGYWEQWDGFFNSGYLEYNYVPFDHTEGSSLLDDHTVGDVDSFYCSAINGVTFTCESEEEEYFGWIIKLWPDGRGAKPTGQSGHKEVNDGATWTGTAILYIPDPPQTIEFDVWGTWDTGDEYDGYYFDYDPETPTYSAHWDVGGSSPTGFTGGDGGSEGDRLFFEE